jgi:hypothetical protein
MMDLRTDKKIVDIYIKDEGYASIKALSNKAKLACHALDIDNELLHFGKEWCGEKVCLPGDIDGLYQAECGLDKVEEIIELFENAGLVVESEL